LVTEIFEAISFDFLKNPQNEIYMANENILEQNYASVFMELHAQLLGFQSVKVAELRSWNRSE